ncbi:MAG: TetR/AcrR family transcriptional regulator [Solirubrobacteraceae bacterium]
MSEDIGRREAHKRATRAAIEGAAQRLVARQGFEATTVRQIADEAGVTERTFYRYFDGKAGLIADEARLWMERLARGIRERPASEPPLLAVREAMAGLVREIRDRPETVPLWLFADTAQQYEILQRSTPRPLIRFEEAIAAALLARAGEATENRREAELVARVSVAVLRSAGIYRRQLMALGDERAADLEPLVAEAFASLAELCRAVR